MSKVRVIKFCPVSCAGDMVVEFVEKNWNGLWQFIQDTTPPEGFSVTIDDMDESEFKNLPEHMGW